MASEFAISCRDGKLPGEVMTSVAQRMVDVLGIAVAAIELDTSHAVVDFACATGGREEATAIGVTNRLPATQAAFVNGVLAHSLDYDDTHLPSVLHPSASVVPAALASAELVGASAAEAMRAAAAGIEICVRLGMVGFDPATGTNNYFERGQHATSICGTVGSAVAAGLMVGLDADQLLSAMGIAASMGAGIIEANRTGGTEKRLHCGWAAHAGVTAAQLAQRGITGPPTAFEGRFGFFEAWLSGSTLNLEAFGEGLGESWELPGIFFKPYPANHFTHAGIDCAISLRNAGLRPEDVEHAELGVATAPARTIGEPADIKRTPETGYQAQFSGPYTIAAALIGGSGLGLGLRDFTDELARDPRRRAVMAKVSVVPDARCDAIFPYQFPAVLRVKTIDGRELHAEALANRGGPDAPLSRDDLATKFHDNVERRLAPTTSDQLLHRLLREVGPDTFSVEDLLDPLRNLQQ
ncbi:MAG: MmgE/PrpD family protein [Ilumatobacteraceae bacterium]